jgi:competence protein ComEA
LIRHSRADRILLKALPPEPLVVRLNYAGVEEICLLPGIGPSLAARIVEYRDKHGSFASADDLLSVSGIGPATLRAIEPFLEID